MKKLNGHFNHNRMSLSDLVAYTEQLELTVNRLAQASAIPGSERDEAVDRIMGDLGGFTKTLKTCEARVYDESARSPEGQLVSDVVSLQRCVHCHADLQYKTSRIDRDGWAVCVPSCRVKGDKS